MTDYEKARQELLIVAQVYELYAALVMRPFALRGWVVLATHHAPRE
jgi:hypothetical protein